MLLVILFALSPTASARLAIRVDTGSWILHHPNGVCLPEFTGNTISKITIQTCISVSQLRIEEFGAGDTTCTGTATQSTTIAVPFTSGGSTMRCEDVSITGYVTTKSYRSSGCASSDLCYHSVLPVGTCIIKGSGHTIGDYEVRSYKFSTNLDMSHYTSSDCTGNTVLTTRKTRDTCLMMSSETCADGITAATHEHISLTDYTLPSGVASDAFKLAPSLVALAVCVHLTSFIGWQN